MEYNYNPSGQSLFGQDLAYDLRQFYAKIVGQHLEDAAEARKQDKYDIWYKSLEDLHIVVKHRFKKKDDDENEYKNLVTTAVNLANKYPSVWLGQYKDPTACAEIFKALAEIEMYLYEKMDLNNMFGSQRTIQGL